MAAKRLSMRKIREILRLKFECGLSQRDIAKSCSIARSTVGEYLIRASAAGLSWPLPDGVDDAALERLLFPPPASGCGASFAGLDRSTYRASQVRA
jgi:hypothetical protein